MIPRLFLIRPILTVRLVIAKITIIMGMRSHDTLTVHNSPNIDWQARNNEDHNLYQREDP